MSIPKTYEVTTAVTSIRFGDERTTLACEGVFELVVPVGAAVIAAKVFRHDPPTAGEIERAIDEVEDALATTGARQASRGDLRTRAPELLEALGLHVGVDRVTREAVEACFERWVSRALGPAVSRAEAPLGLDVAAALLVLRECMHHLGYVGVRREDGAA